jgi:hypothetical protein
MTAVVTSLIYAKAERLNAQSTELELCNNPPDKVRSEKMKTIKEVEKLAKSKAWCFEHVVFYLQKIIGLSLKEVNKLVDAWDL